MTIWRSYRQNVNGCKFTRLSVGACMQDARSREVTTTTSAARPLPIKGVGVEQSVGTVRPSPSRKVAANVCCRFQRQQPVTSTGTELSRPGWRLRPRYRGQCVSGPRDRPRPKLWLPAQSRETKIRNLRSSSNARSGQRQRDGDEAIIEDKTQTRSSLSGPVRRRVLSEIVAHGKCTIEIE